MSDPTQMNDEVPIDYDEPSPRQLAWDDWRNEPAIKQLFAMISENDAAKVEALALSAYRHAWSQAYDHYRQ